MFTQHAAARAALFRAAATPVPLRVTFAIASFILTALAGCAATPSLPVRPQPADASISVPRADYRSTVGGYRSQRPVGPDDWRKQNDGVAPAPKAGG